jgi:putative glutamine amidotransferase
MRPLIGIPCHAGLRAETERPIYYNNRSYVHAVERAGGVPILIPIYDDLTGLDALLSRLDGLLLSGGLDVDPRYYQEEPHPLLGEINPKLDELELALAHWALREDIPTLGICRGMQVINVALGGNLYQDLSAQYPDSLRHPNWDLPRNHIVHMVHIDRGSRMAEILHGLEVPANSLHHQAVKDPGAGVYICGRSDDGVAELLEVPGQSFMVAAQCHPEEIYQDNPVWSRFFLAFIEACAASIKKRQEEATVHVISLGVGMAS